MWTHIAQIGFVMVRVDACSRKKISVNHTIIHSIGSKKKKEKKKPILYILSIPVFHFKINLHLRYIAKMNERQVYSYISLKETLRLKYNNLPLTCVYESKRAPMLLQMSGANETMSSCSVSNGAKIVESVPLNSLQSPSPQISNFVFPLTSVTFPTSL